MKDKYDCIEIISTYNRGDEHFVISFKFISIDYPIRVIVNTQYKSGYSILCDIINGISEIIDDPLHHMRSNGCISLESDKDNTLPSGNLKIYSHSIFQNQIVFEYSVNGKIQIMITVEPKEIQKIIEILSNRAKYCCKESSCGLI